MEKGSNIMRSSATPRTPREKRTAAYIKARRANYRLRHREKNRNYKKTYNRIHREEIRLKAIKYRHGITNKQYHQILASQSGTCAICKRLTKRFYIDHDHTTGKIRGALCNKCNMGLGHFGDSSERLLSAVRYLKKSYWCGLISQGRQKRYYLDEDSQLRLLN